jgi:hypothetical protein
MVQPRTAGLTVPRKAEREVRALTAECPHVLSDGGDRPLGGVGVDLALR